MVIHLLAKPVSYTHLDVYKRQEQYLAVSYEKELTKKLGSKKLAKDYILELYLKGREYVTRAYFHSMLHLIFRHAFDRRIANDALWDLACDIAVENIINELNLNICGKGLFAKQESIAEGFKQKLKNLTAEKLYRYFLNINLSESDAAPVSYTHLDVYKRQVSALWMNGIYIF